MLNKIKVSIIVPVYNVERYLRRCVDSILAQTFKDFELLLIDDGSPDNCGVICDKYAEKDKRVHVFHKPNGGVSSARNIGIVNARGEWITFIDSDDFISPSFLDGLYAPIIHGEAVDFVQGGCTNWKGDKPVGLNQIYKYYEGNKPDIVFKNFRGLVFSKLFRLDNIMHWKTNTPLFFDENMKIAEDMAFTLDYLITVKRYAFVSEVGYYYRKDSVDSATKIIKFLPYREELYSFKHIYQSTINYINTNNLNIESCKYRYALEGNHLQKTILALYRSDYTWKIRHLRLKEDFSNDELCMLGYAQGNKIKKYIFMLMKYNTYLFDGIVVLLYKLKILK